MSQDLESSSTTSLITLGHIDHGKSTTMGRFLYEIGAVDQRTIDRLEAESQELKRASWKWAYVLDSTDEERQGGITADIAFQPFTIENKQFMLIDAPGHRDYVKNAIRGAVLADACMVLVSVVPNDLRSGLKIGSGSSDPGGQTREHCVLGSVLGINQVIFLINKMDMVDYSEESYKEAVLTIQNFLKEIQSPWTKFLTENSFIPICGLEGENLAKKSENMSWWNGPTVIDALKHFSPIVKPSEKVRFLTHDSFDMPGIGPVLHGRLISGNLKVEDKVVILPNNQKTEVKELWNVSAETIPIFTKGNYGIISLKTINKDDIIPGTVISDLNNFPITPKSIQLRVLILTNANKPLIPGSNVILHVGLSHTSAQIDEIVKIERSKKPRKEGQKIMLAFPGELVVMNILPDMPIIVEKFSDQPILGRAVLRKDGSTIAVGQIINFN